MSRRSPSGLVARRRRRSPEVAEQEILDAARNFLADHEFRELTVNALMANLGRPRPIFYHYFKDRAAVLLPLLDEAQAELLEAGTPWLTGAAHGPEALANGIARTSEVWVKHRGVLLAAHDGSAHEPKLAERYRGVIDEWATVVARRLRAERRSGRTTLRHPEQIASALTLMNINVLAERLGRKAENSPAEVTRTLSKIWISTIYPDQAGDA